MLEYKLPQIEQIEHKHCSIATLGSNGVIFETF